MGHVEELCKVANAAREYDETKLERYSSDNAVRMIVFARKHRKLDLPQFSEKASKLRFLKSLNEVEKQCLIAFGCAVLGKLNGISRAKVWDFIVSGDDDCPCVLQNHDANMVVVNSYYENNTSITGLEGVVAGLHAWWHNNTIFTAVYCALEHGYSFEAAYAAKIMAC